MPGGAKGSGVSLFSEGFVWREQAVFKMHRASGRWVLESPLRVTETAGNAVWLAWEQQGKARASTRTATAF